MAQLTKKDRRLRRATRARAKIREIGTARLTVHRTPRHIYAQVTTPDGARVLVVASTVQEEVARELKGTGNAAAAAAVGRAGYRAVRIARWIAGLVSLVRIDGRRIGNSKGVRRG